MVTQTPPAILPIGPVLGPRPPTAFERRWPGPLRPVRPVVLGAAGVTGVVAAACVPLDRAGVGWMVTGLAATAALVTLSRRDAAERIQPLSTAVPAGPIQPLSMAAPAGRIQPLWMAATIALLGAGTVRAAGWLFVLCLLTAAVTGSLAVVRATSMPALAAAAYAVPVAALRALPWGARGMAALARDGRGGSLARAGAVLAASLALLLVFGGLFASADAAFAELLGDVTPDLGTPAPVRWVFVLTATASALLGSAYLLAAPPDLAGLERPAKARLRRLEWTVPLAVLNAVFATFVIVQLTVLFGGSKHVLETAGLTYAEYARRGFWQLLAVTALTLVVLAAAARWAPRTRRADRILVRVLLGGLAALCLVIVASALYRMHTYQEALGFTRLRVLVSVCELWLGLVLAMVLVAGVRLRAGWLPRALVGSAVAALIGIVGLDPDRFIADRNVDRYQQTGRIDVSYLSGLSADAVPALVRLPYPLRDCALSDVAGDLRGAPDDWRAWNLSRARARTAVAGVAPGTWHQACGPRRVAW